MKTYGYTPYGNWQAINLIAKLSRAQASELVAQFGEYIQIMETSTSCHADQGQYTHQPKYKIQGCMPSTIYFGTWLQAWKLAKLRSAADFANAAVIAEESKDRPETLGDLPSLRALADQIDDPDDLPF